MDQHEARKNVDEVFSLYEQYGNADYIGEPVSQLEHMCQAAQLAAEAKYDDEVILAAFFHDIGHLCEYIMDTQPMEGLGITDHELIAGNYLREKGFSEKMAKLVESHVRTKRYLTFRFPDYYNKLSEASKRTLELQGGVMNEQEAIDFESDPLHPLYIQLREWDDEAKREHQPLPSLEIYKNMALKHLLSQN